MVPCRVWVVTKEEAGRYLGLLLGQLAVSVENKVHRRAGQTGV